MKAPERSWISPKIEVRPSTLEGKGLFACREIEAGDVVLVWGGRGYVDEKETAGLRAAGAALMRWDEDVFSFAVDGEDETPFLINHSCDPNVWMQDAFTLVARRKIQTGEEITADYAFWEADPDYFSAWTCQCRAPLCRKKITGSDWKNPELQRLYGDHFSPWVKTLIKGQNAKKKS